MLHFGAGTGGSRARANDGMGSGGVRPVIDGIVTSASNPYWSLWWATIGLGYLLLSRGQGSRGVLAFFPGTSSRRACTSSSGRRSAGGAGSPTGYTAASSAQCAVFLVFFALTSVSRVSLLSTSCSGRISSMEHRHEGGRDGGRVRNEASPVTEKLPKPMAHVANRPMRNTSSGCWPPRDRRPRVLLHSIPRRSAPTSGTGLRGGPDELRERRSGLRHRRAVKTRKGGSPGPSW